MGVLLIGVIITRIGNAFAYEIPQDNSRVKYFYVFGPDGSPLYGAEDHELELFIDVPADDPNKVTIDIFDPNIGGARDWKTHRENSWDTITEFAVYGNKLLRKEIFGKEGYDKKYFKFGPFSKREGERIGNAYRFRLRVKTTNGDDANLFKVRISPDTAAAFSYNITFRLLPHLGDEMFFYPEIPQGANGLTVYNYDIDREGGSSALYDYTTNIRYAINDSTSGEWSKTDIPLSFNQTRRLTYKIVKATQKYGHAGLRIEDNNGNSVPIYFRKGSPKVAVPPKFAYEPKCNRFTFDATNSYDPDNQELSFLWDFGDGRTSSRPVVTHIYEKGGEYTVTLTVKDDSGLECDTAVISQKVKANIPPAAKFTAPDLICAGDEITFDGSGSHDDISTNLSYHWDFGDDTTAEGAVAKKIFEKGGAYQVVFTVNDNEGTPCSMDVAKKTVRVNTPPVAEAGGDIKLCLDSRQEYNVSFDGSGSYDKDDDKLSYIWDFGDGARGTGKRPSHVYARGGVYRAKLTVSDKSGSVCNADTDTILVNLNRTPVADAGKDITACIGSQVLLDGSGSYDDEGEDLTYAWDFGDGAKGTGAKAYHAYSKGGTYRAVLVVDDGRETACSTASDSILVAINTSPNAALARINSICIGKRILFDASKSNDSDGDPLKYTWNFGDGRVIEGRSKEYHTYSKGGTYSVSVTVDDGKGTTCSLDSTQIVVRANTPPIADAGPNNVCCLGAEAFFDGSSSTDPDGDTLKYLWDFGDGETATGAKVAHVYGKIGKYTVTLAVDDGSGTPCSSSTDTFEATVNERPVPIIRIR